MREKFNIDDYFLSKHEMPPTLIDVEIQFNCVVTAGYRNGDVIYIVQ